MPRPGIMLYFDILEPIKVLSDADKGRLLVAMLEYGEKGILPAFDGMLALAWGFVKPSLDRDEEAYEATKVQRKYAAFCKQRTALKLPKIPFDEWMTMTDGERKRMLTADNEPLRAVNLVSSRNPTSTSTSTTTSTSISTPTPTTSGPERCPEKDFQRLWNEYPEDRRGSMPMAMEAFRMDITSPEDADTAFENLALWKRSEQWTKSGGQYVPYLENWLSRGIWNKKPKKLVGAQKRELDSDEQEAIRRMLEEGEE